MKPVIKRCFLSCLVVAVSCFTFSSCDRISSYISKESIQEQKKTLNIAVFAKIKGMDPIFANDSYSANEVARVYEGLLEYHYLKRPYTLVPNLAEEMPVISKDGLIYTFKIRKKVFFQDDQAFINNSNANSDSNGFGAGKELTADDFVYSFKRLADPKLQSAGWWAFDGKILGLNEWREKNSKMDIVNYDEYIEGIKSLDKYTLQITLKKIFPQFLYMLAMPYTFVVAKEVVSFYGDKFSSHPIGTGPFVLKNDFKIGSSLTYVKNTRFRDKYYPVDASSEFNNEVYLKDSGKKIPFIDQVNVNIITESWPAWLHFQKGEIDYIAIPKDNFSSVITPNKELSAEQKEKGIQLMIGPSLDVTYMGFNHDLKIFKNVKLRRAMSLAYDQKKYIELFRNGRGIVAHSLVPPGISGHILDFKNPYSGPNLEEAKKLMIEAGFSDGKNLPEITYDCSAIADSRQGAEFFQREMAQIGIKIKVIPNQWPELQKKLLNRNFMMYGLTAWAADYPDAENFFQIFYGPNKSPGPNNENYSNVKFDELYRKISYMADSAERSKIYEEMYKMIALDMPVIFGDHRLSFVLYQGWLQNYIIPDVNTGSAQYWNIDLQKKNELKKNFLEI